MSVQTRKSFTQIEDDYQFFVDHSNEGTMATEALLHEIKSTLDQRECAVELTSLPKRKQVRILDFGCGDGKLIEKLVLGAVANQHSFDLTLVEPSENYRNFARERFSKQQIPVQATGSISEIRGSFDFVIANHVLYYVQDLKKCVESLVRSRRSESRVLITLGNRSNGLIQICQLAHQLMKKPYPFHVSEDAHLVLEKNEFFYEKKGIASELKCKDTLPNRVRLLRFILGHAFDSQFLSLFDSFVRDGDIVLLLTDDLYVIHPSKRSTPRTTP